MQMSADKVKKKKKQRSVPLQQGKLISDFLLFPSSVSVFDKVGCQSVFRPQSLPPPKNIKWCNDYFLRQ